MLNAAVFAAMPTASIVSAAVVKPGRAPSRRAACGTSSQNNSISDFYPTAAAAGGTD